MLAAKTPAKRPQSIPRKRIRPRPTRLQLTRRKPQMQARTREMLPVRPQSRRGIDLHPERRSGLVSQRQPPQPPCRRRVAQTNTYFMRFNAYDNVIVQPSTVSSVAINSLTGSSAVNGDAYDTSIGIESLMVHVRAEIASGSPSSASVAWALQESTV